ncbi:MAG TPA: hypothetical protein DEG69_10915 [Flavobacteriaceae bacterium]|nr:hypothetical protein [Flavobacteriaceae bacterium]|tara:strand:+ start:329 stop:517 length:189 start_codon:yes stop_codon:yes gene_type:complete
MKAILRNRDEWVNTHKNKIKLHDEQYPCWQPDELDDSEFNLIILVGDELYRVTSTDFDFTNN